MVFGILIAIVVIAVLYVGTMAVYFYCRRKFSHVSIAVELVTVLIALAISIGMRFTVAWIQFGGDVNDVSDGFSFFLYSVYSGVGGLTFEGIDLLDGFMGVLFTASVVYAGLITLSVITAKASYEIYSRIYLLTYGRFFPFSKNKDFFVFTTVTEDALLLAEDICAQYDGERHAELKGRKAVILFAGTELGAFDRKDPLHREIMSRGYLFCNYAERSGGKQKSMLKRFHLDIRNDGYLAEAAQQSVSESAEKTETEKTVKTEKKRDPRRKSAVHIFSLGVNRDLTGFEAQNSALIFGEMERILSEMKGPEHFDPAKIVTMRPERSTAVDFHILTNRKINYEFYEEQRCRCIRKALEEKFGSDLLEAFDPLSLKNLITREWGTYIRLHVFNEALLASESLIAHRGELIAQNPLRDSENLGDHTYHAMILGFGETGQTALNALMCNCVDLRFEEVDGESMVGCPTDFVADVYDTDVSRVSGNYALNHPLCICVQAERDHFTPDSAYEAERQRILSVFAPILEQNGGSRTEGQFFASMAFPVVAFHNDSCFDLSFARLLDARIDGSGATRGRNFYNSVVIALGDDEDNLAMANMLIDDLKHERASCDEKRLQIIYVNLRDEKNYFRLNWTKNDERELPYLAVVPFGRRDEMYSYDSIVDVAPDFRYNCGYEEASKDGGQPLMGLMHRAEAGREVQSVFDAFSKKTGGMDEQPPQMVKSWYALSAFTQRSNRAARVFRVYFHALTKSLDGYELYRLIKLEHARWNRFHIANGWTYRKGDTKAERDENKKRKEHSGLIPFEALERYVQAYDLVNVILAASD